MPLKLDNASLIMLMDPPIPLSKLMVVPVAVIPFWERYWVKRGSMLFRELWDNAVNYLTDALRSPAVMILSWPRPSAPSNARKSVGEI